MDIVCPRCEGTDFREVDCGPDSWDDDITYTSDICNKCGLWLSGWTDRWLIDCEYWQQEEYSEEFNPTKREAPRKQGD